MTTEKQTEVIPELPVAEPQAATVAAENPTNVQALRAATLARMTQFSEQVQEPMAGIFGSVGRMITNLVDSAAGYDEKIINQYGTSTDQKRRRNIGRAILVATAVGSLGWFTKILIAFPGPLGFPIALTMGILYAVLSYSLESFFAANVDPFASIYSKLFSLTGRVLLSAVIAFAGAMPWVTMSLKASVKLEMSKMALQEQNSLRKGLDDTYGLAGISAKAAAFQEEAKTWSKALTTMPPEVQLAMDTATTCASDFEKIKDANETKNATLTSRLPVLAKMESARDVSNATIKAVANERALIQKTVAKLNQEIMQKGAECKDLRATAESARTAHLKFASQERDASQKRLALLRQEEGSVDEKVRNERVKVDTMIAETSQDNSSAEFSALVKIIQTQLFAQLISGLIFLGLLLIDSLPLTLRLFARPGPYDYEKRADDKIKMMRAEGRLMEAEMMHEARRVEMESKELKEMVQKECQPHIRAIALNGVSSFLRKQPKAAAA